MTLGEKGALLFSASTEKHFPAIAVRVKDSTGAGDAFNAGLAVALAHGESIEDAARFGIVTGAMAVTKDGVIPSLPRVQELIEFCALHRIAAPSWLNTKLSPPNA